MVQPLSYTFKKSDFINPSTISEKLGNLVDSETIYRIMKNEYLHGATFTYGKMKHKLIYIASWAHHNTAKQRRDYRLHPLGFECFKEILSEKLNLGDKLKPYKWDYFAAQLQGADHEI